MAVSVESTKPKRTAKVLAHLEIHPKLGGGHIVKHVYEGYDQQPKSVKFNEQGKSQGGETIQAHLAKHAGLPPGGEAPAEQQEMEGEE